MPAPKNLIHESSATTGTGNFTLSAVSGKIRFSDATYGFGTGGANVFDYFISNREAAEWEIGTGSMSAANTLVRDTVVFSSNANAAVNFSAGTKDVTNDIPAAAQIYVPADPGADRIVFWDDSAGNHQYLSLPTGLAISGTALALDFNSLTTDNSFDRAVDFIPYYDAVEGAHNKVALSSLLSWQSIASGSLSGSTVSLTNIPQTFSRLMLEVSGMSVSAANTVVSVQVDSDNGASYDTTAANYDGMRIGPGTGQAQSDIASLIAGDTAAPDGFADMDAAETASFSLIIEGYQQGSPYAHAYVAGVGTGFQSAVVYLGTTPINAIRIITSTGTFDAGTYALYGM